VTSFLLPVCLVTALVDWLAVARGWRPLEYFAKPAVMVLLLVWLLVSMPGGSAPVWFAAGIGCSLVGDVLLMLPRSRVMQGGLAFLLAHLAYTTGFNLVPPTASLPGILVGLAVTLLSWQLYRRLAAGAYRNDRRMAALILIYTIAITLMLISALLNLFKAGWILQAALLVSLGAMSFYLSDSLLAWNRFVTPSRYGRLPEMITYHLGQILIISGVILQFR
jgi:uncharacterized membrane protein YhhN